MFHLHWRSFDARHPADTSCTASHRSGAAGPWLRRMVAALALAAAALPPTQAANPAAVVVTEQARAELLAHAPGGLVPGQPAWLGLKIEHREGWHTYWKNPGDSGLPTTLQFTLPGGVRAGDIAWPTPRPLPVGPLVNYGYEGTLLLRVPLEVPAGFQGSSLDVRLRADWLICKEVCIPEGGDFQLSIPVQAATSLHGALFEQSAAQVPRQLSTVRGSAQVVDQVLQLRVDGLPEGWRGQPLRVLPADAGIIDNAARATTAWAGDAQGGWSAKLPLWSQRTDAPSRFSVVLVKDGEPAGIALEAVVAGTWPAPAQPPSATAAAAQTPAAAVAAAPAPPLDGSVWAAAGLAFLGGLLLNLMPCVFPVLSLKILGFARDGATPRQHLAAGWAYTAGVVLSFLALAGLLLALRAGGEQLGWGFQLQSPLVVALLAGLFTLIGLNLAGVFEIGHVLPSSWASARARSPLADAALTGVLAVAVASPCTAPFMGASLGLAAALPPAQALLVFAALGFGMAAPYLAASAWPGLARVLPRPGAWMLHLRVFLSFPMFATVVWLAWVLGQQAGIDAVAGLLGTLVALSLAVWAWGAPSLAGGPRRVFGLISLACLGLALVWAVPSWRSAEPASPAGVADSAGTGTAQGWQPWSAERVRGALAEGRPVFVDFTAAWCVTCQFNKRTVLADAALLADFQARRVLLLRADWTRRDPAISAELSRMQRQGVPVYALHAPGRATPQLLSEILSLDEVREALRALP